MREVTVTEDIRSYVKSKGKEFKLYAAKGTKVKVICQLGDVLICMAKEEFPVHINRTK